MRGFRCALTRGDEFVVAVPTPRSLPPNSQQPASLSDVQRDDYDTLQALGFSDDEMRSLGLWAPAVGDPAELAEAYLRRSKKREDVVTLRSHLRNMCEWASRNGLTIRHVWFEQLSASKRSVKREQFEGCTAAVLNGASKTMLVWKTDRFDRRGMGAVGTMLDEFDRRRARLVCTVENLDSSAPGSRIVFAILAERAREEAKDITMRVVDGLSAHKTMGRRGVGAVPFGLRSPRLDNGEPSGRVEHHPDEYPVARRIAEMLLGSSTTEPMSSHRVVETLNAEGIPSRNGGAWSATVVRRLVSSPVFAGMVPQSERLHDEYGNPLDQWSYQSQAKLDSEGKVMMCGTGVITPAEYYRIQELIASRRNTENRGRRSANHLGTGILRCGRCSGLTAQSGTGYRCSARMNKGLATCEGVSATLRLVDEALGEAWVSFVSALEPDDPRLDTIWARWTALSRPELTAEQEHSRVALEAAQKRVQALEDAYYVKGTMTAERFAELSAQQQTTIELLRAKATAVTSVTSHNMGDWMELQESWLSATVHTKRMLLRSALGPKGVLLLPAKGRGYRTPIADRLDFDWVSATAERISLREVTQGDQSQ